jgi:formate hydrogenlyase subunit 6/NADH:ubiquinone oxidoreductase subunit I
MFDVLLTRWKQGHRTMRYPACQPPELPERFAGRPALDAAKCKGECRQCVAVCPTGAISFDQSGHSMQLDTGRCLFCRQCETVCDAGAIALTRDYQMAASQRDDLMVRDAAQRAVVTLDDASRRLFGRSLKLRQVSAGGCNACETDTNVLGTVAWDLSRFGRHTIRCFATSCRWVIDYSSSKFGKITIGERKASRVNDLCHRSLHGGSHAFKDEL